jgi:curved DNA-binding protein CbpA
MKPRILILSALALLTIVQSLLFFNPLSCVVLVFTAVYFSPVAANAPNLYKVLGLAKGASNEEIKKKYRTLAKQYHPDKNPQDRAAAEQKFIEITQAYEVLGDPEKKVAYDEELRYGGAGGNNMNGGFNPFGGGNQNRAQQWRSRRNPFDVFEEQFGRGNPFENSRGGGGRGRDRGGGEQEQTTTYYFQGADGRMYSKTFRNPSFHSNQQQGFHYEYTAPSNPLISFFLNYLMIPLLPLLIIICCNCCCPSAEEEQQRQNPYGRNQQQQRNNPNNTSNNPAAPATTTPMKLPVVANKYLIRRGVITVVSLNPRLNELLNSGFLKSAFRNDPFLFTRYPTTKEELNESNIGKGDEMECMETVINLYREEKSGIDLIAFTKLGSRFVVFSVQDEEEVEQKEELGILRKEERIQLQMKKWLEKLVDGNVSWNSISS